MITRLKVTFNNVNIENIIYGKNKIKKHPICNTDSISIQKTPPCNITFYPEDFY